MHETHTHSWRIIKSVHILSNKEIDELKEEEQPLIYSSREISVLCTSCGEIKKLNDLK